MQLGKTEKIVYDTALPIAEKFGFEIYDTEFSKEGGNSILRVYLDKPGGINIDECEEFSRALSDALDKNDPIPGNYYLEVSSPGIERRLRHREHFESSIGETVDVRLYKAIDGSKLLTGTLDGFDSENNIILDIDGEKVTVPQKQTARVSIHFDF